MSIHRRVTADRSLYASALADAIDWTESFLATHDGEIRGQGHCDRGERCEAYRHDAEKLARYRKAYSRLVPQEPEVTSRTVTLTELAGRSPESA